MKTGRAVTVFAGQRRCRGSLRTRTLEQTMHSAPYTNIRNPDHSPDKTFKQTQTPSYRIAETQNTNSKPIIEFRAAKLSGVRSVQAVR